MSRPPNRGTKRHERAPAGGKTWSGQKFGAVLLSMSAILSAEYAIGAEDSQQLEKKTVHRVEPIDQNLLAAAIRNPDDGEPLILIDKLPPAIDAGFREALQEPIVRFSLREGDASVVYVKQDTEDNGEFNPDDLSTSLFVNSNTPDTSGVLANPATLPFALVHENTHALNDVWWQDLKYQRGVTDPALRDKIEQVASTCAAINKTVLEQFVGADRDGLVRAFTDASGSDPLENTVLDWLAKDATSGSQDAMVAAAQAIKNDDVAIYDAPHHVDPACNAPSLLSIPIALAHEPLSFSNNPTSLIHLFNAQIALESDTKRAFSCLREGAGISVRLSDFRSISAGHPEDNPTEAASSIVTSLTANPDYFSKCLDRLEPADKALLEAYASAELDLMNYTHPQLIDILRTEPQAAAIIDRLLAIDR